MFLIMYLCLSHVSLWYLPKGVHWVPLAMECVLLSLKPCGHKWHHTSSEQLHYKDEISSSPGITDEHTLIVIHPQWQLLKISFLSGCGGWREPWMLTPTRYTRKWGQWVKLFDSSIEQKTQTTKKKLAIPHIFMLDYNSTHHSSHM